MASCIHQASRLAVQIDATLIVMECEDVGRKVELTAHIFSILRHSTRSALDG